MAGAVSEDIALTAKSGGVVADIEVGAPRPLVVFSGLFDRRGFKIGAGPEEVDVVGSAGLGAGADAALLPPPEGLALNDCSGDTTIDIEVAGLHLRLPLRDFHLVERVNSCGEPIVDLVLHGNRLVEVDGPHQAQNRAEALVHMEPGAPLHSELDPR